MSAVRNWLEEIGLAQYADAFEANDIDTDLLTQQRASTLSVIRGSPAAHRLPRQMAAKILAKSQLAG